MVFHKYPRNANGRYKVNTDAAIDKVSKIVGIRDSVGSQRIMVEAESNAKIVADWINDNKILDSEVGLIIEDIKCL
ncbi:hypothetical protein Ddye_016006 [Dipteronia dyeriana]|uniref:Uncharacterized protein n=1 Tax=Dipteronia dyeriana TaxID=168575 RepID=A0AAD9U636_9ROSI|nr:hypothetical protein Ddye_016006 [Dipteronia dyeriana]